MSTFQLKVVMIGIEAKEKLLVVEVMDQYGQLNRLINLKLNYQKKVKNKNINKKVWMLKLKIMTRLHLHNHKIVQTKPKPIMKYILK